MSTATLASPLHHHHAFLNQPVPEKNTPAQQLKPTFWKTTFNFTHMLLHAAELRLPHPVSGEELIIRAEEQEVFRRGREVLGLV